jgi:ABC-type phosphate transport system permease subunit
MDNIFLVAGIISVIFFIAKFLEMQYIEKESKPLKILIRDALVVYVSVIFGMFILDQLTPVIKETSEHIQPIAFTDNPPF